MMKILGLDLGDKSIGVALSDELGLTAQPLQVIRGRQRDKVTETIGALVEQHKVTTIVVGLPINMNGSIGPQAQKAQAFIEKLRNALDIEVIPWDERLTTVAAERVMLEADLSRAKRKRHIDKIAAALILQGYLDRKRSTIGP